MFLNKDGKVKVDGRMALFAAALTAATTGPMAPRAPGSEAYAQTRVGVGAEMARIGGSYIRPADATAQAVVLEELGTRPFADNRAQAFERLEAAVDALIASEGIDVRHRDAILRTVRANSNFSSFNITGVHPTEISSGEVVDAMMSRGGAVAGRGGQLVRMETPIVAGETGRVAYQAERWVVDLGAEGLLVITLPAECQNWAVKLIPRQEIAAAVPREAPCPPQTNVVVEGLPAESRVTAVLTMRDGAQLRSIDGQRCPGSTIPDTCPDCTRQVATNLAGEVAAVQGERVRIISAQTYTVEADGQIVVPVGRNRVTLNDGRVVTLDLAAGLQDGSISLTLSCPRDARERGRGNSGLLEESDFARARQVVEGGDRVLRMRWNGQYRVARPDAE